MKILVQKFGGTSVSIHERRILVAQKIKKAIEDGFLPVVVVSAMGRKNDPYSTDTLLSLVNKNLLSQNNQAADLLMSCGEIISTVVMSDELKNLNIDSVPLTGGQAGIITDSTFNNANILNINTDCILNILKEKKVPIIAGFQGITEKGFITTLGRGGSDVTAAALGVALKANKVEIYTDVDGIMTADPRIVKNASLIKEISYNEVFQFADQGAKVIHPRAVEIAMKGNVPLVVKNTLTNCYGTVINNSGMENANSIITGITHMSNRLQVTINYSDNDSYYNIFDLLSKNNISIDLINIFPKQKIFTIDQDKKEEFIKIINHLNLDFSYIENCSKIAIIGNRMRGIPGVMAKILRVLNNEKIQVLQTADSHTTIWCLIESKFVDKAIISLHNDFQLNNE